MYQATQARQVSGLGAYYASKFEQPIAGLGACPCSARPSPMSGAVEPSFPGPGKLVLAFGAAAFVTWAICQIDIARI